MKGKDIGEYWREFFRMNKAKEIGAKGKPVTASEIIDYNNNADLKRRDAVAKRNPPLIARNEGMSYALYKLDPPDKWDLALRDLWANR